MSINFYIPGFTSNNLAFSLALTEIMKRHPEAFYTDFKISAFYGSFNTAIWNGGRPTVLGQNIQPSLEEMKNTIDLLKSQNIPICYTYTNSLLQEKHLSDTFCNKTLELAYNNSGNGIILSSEILESYLREKYPNFKYILSTTKFLRDPADINQATEKYDMVVIDGRDSKNFEFLNKLKNKDKIEIMLNLLCAKNCPSWEMDYKETSAINLFELEYSKSSIAKVCPRVKNLNSFDDFLKLDSIIKIEELFNTYIKMGFTNFKIVGRVAPPDRVLDSYLYYLCKPEYKDSIKAELVKFL
jgi:collagenase-like PrtC family protease